MGSLWNRSGIVERYADDIRADGAKAFFFQGGTTTPLTVYRDAGSNSAHPIPVVADANGRWPDVFVPYIIGYDVQVKSKDDVQITFTLGIPNPDPVDLSVVIPAEERIQTGMIIPELTNNAAPKPGFVKLNGNTIGNASSLASERAHPTDTLPLFTYLWSNLTNAIAPVLLSNGTPTGRGPSASSDFNNNRQITLPSLRGMSLIGLDTMGAAAANAFAGLTFNSGSATQAGSYIGANSAVLNSDQMPAHAHTGTTAADGAHGHSVSGSTNSINIDHTHTWSDSFTTSSVDLNHRHTFDGAFGTSSSYVASGSAFNPTTTGNTSFVTDPVSAMNHAHTGSVSGTTSSNGGSHAHTVSGSTNTQVAHSHTFTTSTIGGTTAINMISNSRLVTWFIKL